ncbi:rhodanese-like domain-containing protein [Megalodesulfovibrio paquesii]
MLHPRSRVWRSSLVLALLVLGLSVLLASSAALAETPYNFIAPDVLHKRLEAKEALVLIDICVVEQFKTGHIPGSLETNAYPVETDAERARLAEKLPKIKESGVDVIIVCPRGGGGAKRAVDYYLSQGVDAKRLLILEKGMDGWPYEKEAK